MTFPSIQPQLLFPFASNNTSTLNFFFTRFSICIGKRPEDPAVPQQHLEFVMSIFGLDALLLFAACYLSHSMRSKIVPVYRY